MKLENYRYSILLSILFLFSCKTSKAIVNQGPVPDRSETELTEALEMHNYQFDWVTSKADMNVESPDENFKGTLYFRLKRDSIIWTVMKKFSAEAIRVLITKDSIYALDRLNTQYSINPYSKIASVGNIDLEFVELQDFLFGNVSTNGAILESIENMEDEFVMTYSTNNFNIEYHINAYTLELTLTKVSQDNGKWVSTSFGNYKMVSDKIALAHEREVKAYDPANGLTKMRLEFKELEVDVPKTTKFSIPDHYEKVD